jgi:hypothetical protein
MILISSQLIHSRSPNIEVSSANLLQLVNKITLVVDVKKYQFRTS